MVYIHIHNVNTLRTIFIDLYTIYLQHDVIMQTLRLYTFYKMGYKSNVSYVDVELTHVIIKFILKFHLKIICARAKSGNFSGHNEKRVTTMGSRLITLNYVH